MKRVADLVIILILTFIFLAIRRIYKLWFSRSEKLPQKTTAPPQVNIQNNYNTVNVVIVKEKE